MADRAAGAVRDAIEAAGPHTVSAFIGEPVSPSAGMAVPPAGYWKRIREICDRYGILFIADEVITGAGRTGRFLAMEHFETVPDLTNLAKGLSGGYVPLGATLIREEVAEAVAVQNRCLAEVHTFSGAPISCATGLAVLDAIENEGLVEAAEKKGFFLRSLLEEELGELPIAGEIRGLGLMAMVEYVRSRDTREKLPPEWGAGLRAVGRNVPAGGDRPHPGNVERPGRRMHRLLPRPDHRRTRTGTGRSRAALRPGRTMRQMGNQGINGRQLRLDLRIGYGL